jgi:hypothetical protein
MDILMDASVLHLVSTLLMAGVISFVQAVHYPLMARVGEAGFREYETAHADRTTWVVAPLMVTELVTAVLLVLPTDAGRAPLLAWAGLGILVVIWLSTALLQVPAHRTLSKGFDPDAHRRLVRTNWIRTLGWWGRVPVAVVLASGIPPA